MFPMRTRCLFAAAVMGLLWVSPLTAAQDSRISGQAAATTASATASATAAALAEVPTGQAIVEYQNAALTIKAQRAPLIDVLREVCTQIGAELDAPPEANEPVVGIFGPGAAREVLTSLLDSSRYELATAGSAEDANAIVRVVVFSKTKDSTEQGNKDQDAPTSTAERTSQPHVDSMNAGEKASAQEMMELLNEAKSNFVDNEAESGDPNTEVQKGQAGEIFKALEALLKTAAAVEASNANSLQSKQPAAGAVPHPVRRRH